MLFFETCLTTAVYYQPRQAGIEIMAHFTWGSTHVRLAIRAETKVVGGARARLCMNTAVHFKKGKGWLSAAGYQCPGCLFIGEWLVICRQ